MPKLKDMTTILIDSFGEVFLELVLSKKISQEQYLLLLEETKKKVGEKLHEERTKLMDEIQEFRLRTLQGTMQQALHKTRQLGKSVEKTKNEYEKYGKN